MNEHTLTIEGPPPGFENIEDSAFAQSETITELYAAIVEANSNLTNVVKDRDVKAGAMNYSYTTLGAIMGTVRGPLAAAGLAIIHGPVIGLRPNATDVSVATRVIHSSGEWTEVTVLIPVAGNAGAHPIGSAMTYAKRYGVTALLALASDEDDDGHAANNRPPSNPGDYEKQPPQEVNIKQAKGAIFEAVGKDGELALLFWREMNGDKQGPFTSAGINAQIALIPQWLEGRQPAESPETPAEHTPAPETGEDAELLPEHDTAAQEGTQDEEIEGDGSAEDTDPVPTVPEEQVDEIIGDVKQMPLKAVRDELGAELLSVTGNGDTLRARLAEHRIRNWTAE